MLSKLRRFSLVDGRGRRSRLDDLAIALLESDHPPVTRLLFQDADGRQMALPWEAVESINWHHCRITVSGFDAAGPAAAVLSAKEVLLRRDVIDALVLDLRNRRATRANDLWLEEDDGRLLLKAADTSSRAVLRRLSRGLFGDRPSRAPYDWKYIEFLRGDPRGARSGAGYRMRINRLPPGEIAGLCSQLPYLHAAELLTLLPDPAAADTLEAMKPERQLQVVGELDEDQVLRLLALMAPDDATDLLGRLQPEQTKRLLERLPKSRSERLVELLRYPEDTVGGIMTNDVVMVPADLTAREARLALRDRLKEPDFTYFIYVVESDETRVLRGMTGLRDLVMADDDQRLEELMNPYLSTLSPLEPARAAAYRVLDSHLAALPVVGRGGRLLGIVTVDAAVAQAAPEGWRAQAPKVFS